MNGRIPSKNRWLNNKWVLTLKRDLAILVSVVYVVCKSTCPPSRQSAAEPQRAFSLPWWEMFYWGAARSRSLHGACQLSLNRQSASQKRTANTNCDPIPLQFHTQWITAHLITCPRRHESFLISRTTRADFDPFGHGSQKRHIFKTNPGKKMHGKMVAGDKIPGQKISRKMVPGKMVPGKMVF